MDVKFITNSQGITLMQRDSMLVMQGDIVLSKLQLDLMENLETRGSELLDYTKQWPFGIIFYKIDYNEGYPVPNGTSVREYLDCMEGKTNLRFWEYTPEIVNYIAIIGDSGNFSNMGMIGGKQYLRIHDISAIPHEMLHAIGFGHEQGRRDRDQHIIINWDNIQSKWKYAFDYNHATYGDSMIDIGTFDFSSIMLYSSYNSFAIDATKPTMTKKNGSAFYSNYSQLSSGDITMVNNMYPNKYAYDILPVFLESGNESGKGWDIKYNWIMFVANKTVSVDTRIGIRIHLGQYDGYGNDFSDDYITYVTIPAGSRSVKYKFTYQSLTYGGDIDDWTVSNRDIDGYDFPPVI